MRFICSYGIHIVSTGIWLWLFAMKSSQSSHEDSLIGWDKRSTYSQNGRILKCYMAWRWRSSAFISIGWWRLEGKSICHLQLPYLPITR